MLNYQQILLQQRISVQQNVIFGHITTKTESSYKYG